MKRILLINDFTCMGKCSLTVQFPLIVAAGFTCDVLPTALLSSHTGFESPFITDLTIDMENIISKWMKIGIKYDVILCGYLLNEKQVNLVLKIKKMFLKNDGLFLLDPVMADKGKLYSNFSLSHIDFMKKLAIEANYIFPNYTEACFLSNKEYNKCKIKDIFDELKRMAKNVIITGYEKDDYIRIYYDDDKFVEHKKLDISYPGTGDIFSILFLIGLLFNLDLETNIKRASEFILQSIENTIKMKDNPKFGLFFEDNICTFINKLKQNN